MKNLSGLEPRGRAVLVQMDEGLGIKSKTIAIPDVVRDRTEMVEQKARVVAIGETAWKDEGFWEPWCFGLLRRWKIVPRARVGDVVLVTRFAGYMSTGPADGKRYRLINDRDVFAAVTAQIEELQIEEKEAA